MQIKKLKVIDKWNRDFGILTFDTVKNKFHFKYDDNCNGYSFSDIIPKMVKSLNKRKYLMFSLLMIVLLEVK